MSSYPRRSDVPSPSTADARDTAPAACPTCRSAAIMTTAKRPDVNSYWRCESCGEVWNVSRHSQEYRTANAWR